MNLVYLWRPHLECNECGGVLVVGNGIQGCAGRQLGQLGASYRSGKQLKQSKDDMAA